MKSNCSLVLVTLLLSPLANAEDLNDSASSFDKHPECMERSTDSTTGDCIKQDNGTPSHRSRAATTPTVGTHAVAPAPATPSSPQAAPRGAMGD